MIMLNEKPKFLGEYSYNYKVHTIAIKFKPASHSLSICNRSSAQRTMDPGLGLHGRGRHASTFSSALVQQLAYTLVRSGKVGMTS